MNQYNKKQEETTLNDNNIIIKRDSDSNNDNKVNDRASQTLSEKECKYSSK